MKESSLEVVVDEIEYAIRSSKRFRNYAERYPESDSFHHIYDDIDAIPESYGCSFLRVLFEEGVLKREDLDLAKEKRLRILK